MARKVLRAKTLLLSLFATVCTMYLLNDGIFESSYQRTFRQPTSLDPFNNVTAEGFWYPNFNNRCAHADPFVFRDPDATPIVNSGVIDEIGERTYLLVKTGLDVMWKRLPVHFETTFKRFPRYQIYAETNARILGAEIIDAIAMLPNDVKFSGKLPEYEARLDAMDLDFGWDLADVQYNGGNGWNEDRFKNLPMLYHAWLNAPADTEWYIMIDDDTYMMSKTIGAILRHYNPDEMFYIGSKSLCSDYLAHVGKFADKARTEDPTAKLWQSFAHGGSAIIMSRGLVNTVFQDKDYNPKLLETYAEANMHTSFGDAILGYLFREELGVECNDYTDITMAAPDPFQGETLSTTHIHSGNFCQALASFHHVQPQEIQTLFDWEDSLLERKANNINGVLYADFYHDFMLPYMYTYKEDWDNLSKEISFTDDQMFSENDPDMVPAESPANCSYTCDVYVYCLSWKWEQSEAGTKCSVSITTVGRGFSTDKTNGRENDDKTISGWRLDRIRDMRSNSACDPLQKYGDELFSDNEETSEGWYYRQLDRENVEKERTAWIYDWSREALV